MLAIPAVLRDAPVQHRGPRATIAALSPPLPAPAGARSVPAAAPCVSRGCAGALGDAQNSERRWLSCCLLLASPRHARHSRVLSLPPQPIAPTRAALSPHLSGKCHHACPHGGFWLEFHCLLRDLVK